MAGSGRHQGSPDSTGRHRAVALARWLISASITGAAVLAVVSRSTPAVANTTTPPGSPPADRPAQSTTCDPARPHASGTSVETITTGTTQRNYRLHVPPSYTGVNQVPLVFDFHGATSNAVSQEFYSDFSTKADAEGFVVAYPEGITTTALNYTHFNAWLAPSPEPNDVAFTGSMLDLLETRLCIDPLRVFSTGISNGAMMSVRLACSLSGRFAAVAPVAGAYYPPDFTNVAEPCPDTWPVPMLAFHGTADTVVPFNGGLGGLNGVTSFRLPIDDTTPAEDVLSDWAAHDGCTGARQESQVDTEVRLVAYASCNLGATVELYAVDGGGHTWPGAIDVPHLGYTTHQISATDLIWAFFSAHALAAPVGGVAEQPVDLPRPADAARSPGIAYAAGGLALPLIAALGLVVWRRRRVRTI